MVSRGVTPVFGMIDFLDLYKQEIESLIIFAAQPTPR
jgi:hypothetical protein